MFFPEHIEKIIFEQKIVNKKTKTDCFILKKRVFSVSEKCNFSKKSGLSQYGEKQQIKKFFFQHFRWIFAVPLNFFVFGNNNQQIE